MTPTEISIDFLDRRDLKQKCKRIYNRLVIEDPEFQTSTDELQNIGLVLVYFVLLLGSTYVAMHYGVATLSPVFSAQGEAPPSLINVANFAAEQSGPLSLGLTLIVFALTYKSVSRFAFELSGTGFIQSAKATQNKQTLFRMLEIVERWMQSQPSKVCEVHSFLYHRDAAQLLPDRLSLALQNIKNPDTPDALVIRHFGEKRYWLLYFASFFQPLETDKERRAKGRLSYWREARGLRNAIRVNLVFDVLGTELRDEVPAGEHWRRDYSTADLRQYTALFDPGDLHLRFKTGAPYYRWPSEFRPSSEKEIGTFRLIMCLENPMRCPIDLISVDEIVGQFEPAVGNLYMDLAGEEPTKIAARRARVEESLSLLQEKDVHMYGMRHRRTLRPTADAGLDPEPILKNLNKGKTDKDGVLASPRWVLKWDPNVIDWSRTGTDPDGAHLRALAVLVEAIDLAGDKAEKVHLGRGDALLLDNRRCLVCRREWFGDNVFGGSLSGKLVGWAKTLLFFPDRWWMRGFYGFRKPLPIQKTPGS